MFRSPLFTFISQHISLERWGLCLWRVKVKGSHLLVCWLGGYAWEKWLVLVLNVPLRYPWHWGKQEDHNSALHPRDVCWESLESWRAARLKTVLLSYCTAPLRSGDSFAGGCMSSCTFSCDYFKATAIVFTTDMNAHEPPPCSHKKYSQVPIPLLFLPKTIHVKAGNYMKDWRFLLLNIFF